MKRLNVYSLIVALLFSGSIVSNAQKETPQIDAAELARKTANPIAAMISVPFQFNFNNGIGDYKRTHTLINVMPVIPFRLTDDINIVNRIIIPIVNQPDVTKDNGSTFGLGSVNYSMFFTPSALGKVIWGIGPAFNIPTRSDNLLGSPEFGIGPTLIVLTMPGNWAIGLTANNVWSYVNSNLNAFYSQVFVVYTFQSAWNIQLAPTITANWNAPKGQQWSIPLGANVGKTLVLGKQPIKLSGGGSYFVEAPTDGPKWQLSFQAVFLFPKGKLG